MTFINAVQELCRRLNIDYTEVVAGGNDLFSLGDLKSFILSGVQRAWDFARWIFSEEAVYTETVVDHEYYDYPEYFVSDSIRILKVEQSNGKMKTYTKIRYEDYQRYREEYPDGDDKIFSDYKRFYFINPNTFSASGLKIEIWGKRRATKLSDDDDLLPFSPDTDEEENSGNEAIVKLAYSIALSSDKKKDKVRANKEEKEAYGMLGLISTREEEEQAGYQTKSRSLFKKIKII